MDPWIRSWSSVMRLLLRSAGEERVESKVKEEVKLGQINKKKVNIFPAGGRTLSVIICKHRCVTLTSQKLLESVNLLFKMKMDHQQQVDFNGLKTKTPHRII